MPAYIFAALAELFIFVRLANGLKNPRLIFSVHLLFNLSLGLLLIAMHMYAEVFAVNLNFSLILFATNLGQIGGSIHEMFAAKYLWYFSLDIVLVFQFLFNLLPTPEFKLFPILLSSSKRSFSIFILMLSAIWYIAATPSGSLLEPFFREEMQSIVTFTPFGYVFIEAGKTAAEIVFPAKISAAEAEFVAKFLAHQQNIATNENRAHIMLKTDISKPNIVIIQVESLMGGYLQQKIDDKPVMPFLSKIAKDGLELQNFHSNAVATSDSDFCTLVSLLPHEKKIAHLSFYKNNFSTLPKILNEHGYRCAYGNAAPASFWNTEEFNRNAGFSQQFFSKDLPDGMKINGWLNDRDFLNEAFARIQSLPEPFLCMLLTTSSHHPFNDRNIPRVFSTEGLHGDELQATNYANSLNFVDKSIETFFEKFSQHRSFANTVFVIYGDHPFPLDGKMNQLRKEFGRFPDSEKLIRFLNSRVPCIFYAPQLLKPARIDKLCGQIDLAPTLLDICGIAQPRFFLGKSVLSPGPGLAFHKFFAGRNAKSVFYGRTFGRNSFSHIYAFSNFQPTENDAEVQNAFDFGLVSEMILEFNLH